MFERASRMKLRFESTRGLLTVEDLWDLPLTARSASLPSLDDLARTLARKLTDTAHQVSFVLPTTTADESLQLQFDVVKHVIEVRMAERAARETQAANREKKQKLLSLIAQKQDAQLSDKSVEELQAMVEEL